MTFTIGFVLDLSLCRAGPEKDWDIMEIMVGIVGLVLIVYLFLTIIKPDKF